MAAQAPIAAHMPKGEVVHVLRADPGFAACGIRVHPNRAGAPVPVDTSAPLGSTPGGVPLRWCGKCLGTLAVEAGRGEWLADAVLRVPPEGSQ